MDDGDVVAALSCAEEFKDVLRGNEADSGIAKIEQIISEEVDLGPNAAAITKKDLEKLRGFDGLRRKVLALLWAYLERKRIDGSTLDDGEHAIHSLENIANISKKSTR
jgi:translocation protein SEC63